MIYPMGPIGHMTEEEFKISIDTDDIVDFSSFEKGKQILKKYKVDLIFILRE